MKDGVMNGSARLPPPTFVFAASWLWVLALAILIKGVAVFLLLVHRGRLVL